MIYINSFINYKFTNPFDVLDSVEFNYFESYEELLSQNNCICIIDVNDCLGNEILGNLIYKFLLRANTNKVILSRPTESATKILELCKKFQLTNFFESKQISFLISAEYDDTHLNYCNIEAYSHFISTMGNINISLKFFDKIYEKNIKPYKFLCLNGIDRDHRIDLYNLLLEKNLLESSLYSMTRPQFMPKIDLPYTYKDYFNDENFYVEFGNQKIKKNHWPDGLLNPKLYTDTYFSVVTETECYESNYAHLTEKTYKVLLMGHPFMILSTVNFYKHLKKLGYKTFDELIDENFDNIYDNKERINYFVNSINNLCNSDLQNFLKKSKEICEYNREIFFYNTAKSHINNYKTLKNFIEKI